MVVPWTAARALAAPLAMSLALIGACSSEADGGAQACTTYDPACAPLYEATYAQVFARTLQPTCAKSGVSCHAAGGGQGGLVFDDADRAHALLLDKGVVKPGDARCSELAVRLTASDPSVRMPPGRALDPAEICAIQRWIADGARR
jgi:hypothetical protein